jgi:hypothetical protein
MPEITGKHCETICLVDVVKSPIMQMNAAPKTMPLDGKQFLFHTSAAGAGANAVMYSIVKTAKANNLNVFKYLYMVLLCHGVILSKSTAQDYLTLKIAYRKSTIPCRYNRHRNHQGERVQYGLLFITYI